MAGTLVAGRIGAQTPTRVRFDLATNADDAALRRLLRENPTPGRIALCLQREPGFFTDAPLWDERLTIVAREGGRVVCAGSCAVRRSFVNGQACRVGYLGGLRLDRQVAGRYDILRRGYATFRELLRDRAPDFLFTSIASDNHAARRLLERGLPGMPQYEHVGDFVTLALRVPVRTQARDLRLPGANPESGWATDMAVRLNDHNRRYQFAPCWTGAELMGLSSLGLHSEDFAVVRDQGKILSSAALWDQRGFSQTVVAGYSPWLARLRPVVNLAARFGRRPLLPAPGTSLPRASVSHLAVGPEAPGLALELIEALLGIASNKSIQIVTMGFAASDPQVAKVRASFPCHEYRSRIYTVSWPGLSGSAALDGRTVQPELALL